MWNMITAVRGGPHTKLAYHLPIQLPIHAKGLLSRCPTLLQDFWSMWMQSGDFPRLHFILEAGHAQTSTNAFTFSSS